MTETIDPVTLEVIWKKLRNIPLQMGEHCARTAYSDTIKYARDLSTGLFTRDGDLIAQGIYAPGHLGSMPFMMEKVLDRIPVSEWEPNDVLLTNEPQINSGHLPDLFLFKPVFFQRCLEGFCVVGAHHIDIGGAGVASTNMDAPDMYAEGLQVPVVKLYARGELNEEVLEIIEANSRQPKKVRGDLHAQYGAVNAGSSAFQNVHSEFGPDTVLSYAHEIFDRTERRLRSSISDVPDGIYSFEDELDGFDEPLPVRATVDVEGDEISVDYAGSADQLPNKAINSVWQYTFAYTILALKSVLDPGSPQNQGTVRPISMTAPERSILNAQHPAPVASRQIVCDRVISSTIGALGKAVPEKTPALGGQPHRLLIRFITENNRTENVLFDGYFGGAGARPDADGFPAVSGSINLKNTPVEAIETEHPLVITQYELRSDSSGAGEYRGGSGTIREYEFLRQAEVQLVNERFRFGPPGGKGGNPGRTGEAVLNPGTDRERGVHSKEQLFVEENDVLRIYTSGGGGYGDPAQRDTDRIRDDIIDGFVSRSQAKEVYGFQGE